MERELHEELLKDALNHIPPDRLSYQEWIDVGMALQAEGFGAEVWEKWSERDERHKPGECYSKWQTFKSSGTTGATITHLAQEFGWPPSGKRIQDTVLPFDESLYVTAEKVYMRADPTDPLYPDPERQFHEFIKAAFKPGDKINIVTNSIYKEKDNKWIPADRGFTYPYEMVLQMSEKDLKNLIGDYNERAGVWIRINPTNGGVQNEDVTRFEHVLVESDSMDIEKQIDTMKLLELPITTMTLSGGKSVHAWVKVQAKDSEEYRIRVRRIFETCQAAGLDVDRANRNPARLSRLPGAMRNGKEQSLLALNIGRKSYEDWEENFIIDDLPEFSNLADFADNPPELPPEMINKVLRKGEKLVLTGPSKAGKSFALIQLAVACATGGIWLGRFRCKEQKTVYINLELTKENATIRALDVWKAVNGSHKEGMENLMIWHLRGTNISAKSMVDTLIRRHNSMTNPPDFYIIDPIYKINAGDENAAKDMNELLREFDRLLSKTNANVAYAHHHAKGTQFGKRALDRGSGSGVIGRDADAAIDLDFLYVPTAMKIDKAISKRDESWRDATALRVETTLRNFKNRPPFNVWFKYPLHIYDDSEDFQALKGESEKANFAKAEDGKQIKKEATDQKISDALESLLEESATVRMKDMEDKTGFGRKRIKKFIDESDEFGRNDKGELFRKRTGSP